MTFTPSFFELAIDYSTALDESYNLFLVALSYLVAAIAGFCALSISHFMAVDKQSNHPLLKIVGGTALGLGIWTMHFIGMKALTLPIPVRYDISITAISVVPAILASMVALHITSKPNLSAVSLILTGLILASGIATMHFTGMAALSMQAYMTHHPVMFAIAIITSWGLACLTLFIQFGHIPTLHQRLSKNGQVIVGALTFGFAVATMHYLAMRSAVFFPIEQPVELSGISGSFLTYSLLITLVILICTLTLVLFYKRKIQLLVDLASTNHKYMVETIDNMEDPFMLCDLEGKVLLVNHSYLSEFSTYSQLSVHASSLKQVLTQLLSDAFEFELETERTTALAKLASGSSVRLKRNDNTWWLLRQTKTDADCVIQTWTDVTEQYRAEQEIIAARNAAQTSLLELQKTQDELVETKKMASLGSLVTNVAHELNTPLGVAITSLSSIKSNIDALQQMVEANQLTKQSLVGGIEQIIGFEQLADKNLTKTNNIIQQFKFLSMDQQYEEPTLFALCESVRQVKSILEDVLNAQRVTLISDISDDLEIFSYQDAIFQVLRNIVHNSATHAFSDQVERNIVISANAAEEGFVTMSIKDNGNGIDNSVIENIFEPFVTTKRNEGHIGLGMHIVFNFVSLKLAGRIEIIQSNSQGTEIQITMPRQINQKCADTVDALSL